MTDTNIGNRLGNYVIETFLAEGGMSRVYIGRHNKLNRLVAVKVLKPALADQEHILWRFENEAQAMEKLRGCPDIINVIDFHEEGSFRAIIMELLEGHTLKDLIKKGVIFETEIIQIFSKVLNAFVYAHERNVVHRDVKPSNIFLLNNGDIRVLDFGIAKIANSGEELDYTATGTQMGTLIYMSPEQVLDSKHVDHRSDIYSLGVTLYHCLKGLPPYDQDTLSRFEIQRRIVYEPIEGIQSLAEPYRSIIEKCTAKKPEDRFQSCEELIVRMHGKTIDIHTPQADGNSQIVDKNKVETKKNEQTKQLADDKTIIERSQTETQEEKNREKKNKALPKTEKKKNKFLIPSLIIGVLLAVVMFVWQPWESKFVDFTEIDSGVDIGESQNTKSEDKLTEGENFLAENGKRQGVTTTASGLQYEVIIMGTGPKPSASNTVKTHYRGTFLNGTVFDSSYDRGEPISFPLTSVIPGWKEGLQLMPVGSKFKFYIPYSLAYGEKGAGQLIGPYETLIFEVELLGIEN